MKGTTAFPRMDAKAPFRARLCLLALLVAGSMTGCGSSDSGGSAGTRAHYRATLRGAPPPLAAIYRQGDRLLDGGAPAYRARLSAIRGHAAVVNDWASWCAPCREELPLFGHAAIRFGKRVGFLGVDAQDNPAAARTFLRERPLPYPSFADPDAKISASQAPVVGYPRTVFYDSGGHVVHVKQGPYTSTAELAADIHRYAGG